MDNMNHLLFDFLDKHADMYEGKDAINPELYDLYMVKWFERQEWQWCCSGADNDFDH